MRNSSGVQNIKQKEEYDAAEWKSMLVGGGRGMHGSS